MVNEKYISSVFQRMTEIKQVLEKHRLAKCTEIFGIEIQEIPKEHRPKLEKFLYELAEEIKEENIQIEDRLYNTVLEINPTETGYTLYPKIPNNLHPNDRLKLNNELWRRISSKIKRFEETHNYR